MRYIFHFLLIAILGLANLQAQEIINDTTQTLPGEAQAEEAKAEEAKKDEATKTDNKKEDNIASKKDHVAPKKYHAVSYGFFLWKFPS